MFKDVQPEGRKYHIEIQIYSKIVWSAYLLQCSLQKQKIGNMLNVQQKEVIQFHCVSIQEKLQRH